MICGHANPAGYAYCGKCGQALDVVRCRCGFVAALNDVFCGRCSISLTLEIAGEASLSAAVEHRHDLDVLVQQAALEKQEKQISGTDHKVRVKQDDIRKLLALRRRKF
ncbi:MAG: zinc ribbon domain-containing protein [Gallionella sp.]|nr:zinc ribbon domain-containing protein [Gallionella sp.]